MAAYYFDTSALVKAYVAEIGSGWVTSLVSPSGGNDIHVSRLTAVEVVAALARRGRSGSLSAANLAAALGQFRIDFASQHRVEDVTPALIVHAMALAEKYALRGADAVQLATAFDVQTECASAISSSQVSRSREPPGLSRWWLHNFLGRGTNRGEPQRGGSQ